MYGVIACQYCSAVILIVRSGNSRSGSGAVKIDCTLLSEYPHPSGVRPLLGACAFATMRVKIALSEFGFNGVVVVPPVGVVPVVVVPPVLPVIVVDPGVLVIGVVVVVPKYPFL